MTTVDRPNTQRSDVETVSTSSTRSHATLAEALVALQGQLPEVKKTQTAKVATSKGSYEYSYAGLAAVSAAILPRLSALGLAFVARPTLVGDRFILACELMHTSGEKLTAEYPLMVAPGSAAQAIGSAVTYGRRYCLTAMTGLVAEDDDDAQGVAAAAAPRPAARRTANRSAPKDTGAENSAPVDEVALKRMFAAFGAAGIRDKDGQLDFILEVTGSRPGSRKEMTPAQVSAVIRALDEGLSDDHTENPA